MYTIVVHVYNTVFALLKLLLYSSCISGDPGEKSQSCESPRRPCLAWLAVAGHVGNHRAAGRHPRAGVALWAAQNLSRADGASLRTVNAGWPFMYLLQQALPTLHVGGSGNGNRVQPRLHYGLGF